MTWVSLISLPSSKEDSLEKMAQRHSILMVSLAHSSLCSTAPSPTLGLARRSHGCRRCEWAILRTVAVQTSNSSAK